NDLADCPVLGRLELSGRELRSGVGFAGIAQEPRAEQASNVLDPSFYRHTAQRPIPRHAIAARAAHGKLAGPSRSAHMIWHDTPGTAGKCQTIAADRA